MIPLSFILLTPLSADASAEELDRRFGTLRECGYQGVELNLTGSPGIPLDQVERLARRHNLAVVSFLTGEAYHDGLCLCSPDPKIRARTVERLTGYLDTAERFGAILVVGLLQGQLRDEPDPAVANRRIADGLRQVADAAERRRVDIVIEPVNHLQVGFNHSVEEVLTLIRQIGSPAVRPMIDTIHLNIEEQSLTEPVLACGAALRHVHLCESNGAGFGTGHVDFAAVREALEQVQYAGFASVKVYRRLSFEDAARSSIDVLHRAGFGA
jgi:sugar phosphate isomerase/epimerase